MGTTIWGCLGSFSPRSSEDSAFVYVTHTHWPAWTPAYSYLRGHSGSSKPPATHTWSLPNHSLPEPPQSLTPKRELLLTNVHQPLLATPHPFDADSCFQAQLPCPDCWGLGPGPER